MKVLLSAYACEPGKGSEPAIGWNWARQAARFHEVCVLTRANNRAAIEAALARDPVPGLRFVYHDLPRWARFWKRGGRGVSLYHWLWQITAIPTARRLHRESRFDLAHHVTFVSFRFPSCLAWLPCPFVWGPVAGAERAPLAFWRGFGIRGMAQELLRSASNRLSRLDPTVRHTMRKSTAILAATEATKDSLPRWAQAKTAVVPAIGIEEQPASPESRPPTAGLRVLFAGRLKHWKGVRLAVRAFADFAKDNPDARFTVIGDGPDRNHLQNLAQKLGVDTRVDFVGERSHAETLEAYSSHDVLLFPSFHDSGGLVVLEAMSAGLPIICLDLGGPAMAVQDGAGIVVAAESETQVIRDLAAALTRLASNPSERASMAESARARAENAYSWEAKGEQIRDLYAAATSSISRTGVAVRSAS